MAFVLVFVQELIQGKGIIQGMRDGDPINVAGLGLVAFVTLAFTAFLALKGEDDYVEKELGK
jgi:hypothetical protein